MFERKTIESMLIVSEKHSPVNFGKYVQSNKSIFDATTIEPISPC